MKVITLLNEKGGTGKTTLSTHIAAGLALRGYNVVLVDADPQADATKAVGLEEKGRFYDLTVRNEDWRQVLVPVPTTFHIPEGYEGKVGRLMAVTSNIETRNVSNTISDNRVLRLRFAELTPLVDVIVVDTSPTPSLLHSAITLASDFIVTPTDCEAFSALNGLPKSLTHTEGIRREALSRGVHLAKVAGIVPNKFRKATVLHTQILEYLHKTYPGQVWEPINQAVIFAEVQLRRQSIFALAPDSRAARQMWRVLDHVEAFFGVKNEQA